MAIENNFPTAIDPHRFGESSLRTMVLDAPAKEIQLFKNDVVGSDGIVYIIRGDMTEARRQERDVPEGTTEWEFSNGPINKKDRDGRTSSSDYISLEEGLNDHLGCSFNTDEANFTVEEQALFDKWINDHNQT